MPENDGPIESAPAPDRILDLLVIGLGPAGVSCALQARRDGLELLAVGDEPVGGLLPAARRIDNLAAEPGASGRDLAERMSAQILERGVAHTEGQVRSLGYHAREAWFEAALVDGRGFRARTVCLACGTRPRPWRVPLEGARWLHRDARSLPLDLNGARVAVVGGGEAALDTALSARDRGAEVMLLVRGAQLHSVAGLAEEARERGVELRFGVEPARARWRPGRWTLDTRAAESLELDELVVCIGREPREELAEPLCPQGVSRQVPQPQMPGLYLAGDAIRGRDRYVAGALGDGQRAALLAARHLEEGIER